MGIGVLALAAGLPGAGAQVTKQGDAYLFRLKYTKGQKLNYDVVSTVQMPGGQGAMAVTIPMAMLVKDVTGKISTVQIEVGPMMMNGKPGPQPKRTMDVKLDDRGKTVGGGTPGMQGVNTQLPEKPLKIGESFTSTNSMNIAGQPLNVKSVSRFTGVPKMGGRTVAVLATTATASGALQVKGSGTGYIDIADGSLVSMSMNQEMTMKQGAQSQTMKNVVKVTRK